MNRCLQLAEGGFSNVEPNPYVGCVIVYKGQIIGEGFHREFGAAHAEVHAIQSVSDKALLKESILYVNLEPCSHYGKTPPCVDLIIKYEIPKVCISIQDPNSKVAGNGIAKLKNAGIDVDLGLLEKESSYLNRRFITFYTKKRPYIILKWAQTADGFIDVDRSNPKMQNKDNWISGHQLKTLVHKWRSQEMGILLGRKTIENDNPQLTCREWQGKNPLRIVITRREIDETKYKVFSSEAKTLVIYPFANKKTEFAEYVKLDENMFSVESICEILYQRSISSIIVEGGKQILDLFIQSNIWDEARVITGKKFFINGLTSPKLFNAKELSKQSYDEDILEVFINKDL